MTGLESKEGWLMPCGACGSTTFIPGQREPRYCPRCGNSYDVSDRCNAISKTGAICQRAKTHLTSTVVHNPEFHISSTGIWWTD